MKFARNSAIACPVKSRICLIGSDVGRPRLPVEELIALVTDHAVARAAFVEAVRRRPGKLIILRQKSRVLADSRG